MKNKKSNMFVKDFSKIPFKYDGYSNARTLSPIYIGKHENGWEITGEIKEDYYEWVNDFEAKNGSKWVKGDFESIVEASSEDDLNEFLSLFPYNEWDYGDI